VIYVFVGLVAILLRFVAQKKTPPLGRGLLKRSSGHLWPPAVPQAVFGQPFDHALVAMRVESTLPLLVIEQLTGIGHVVLLSTMSWMVESRNESKYSGWYGLNA